MRKLPDGERQQRERRRVLVVLRWPVGGIRTYVLYNYPTLLKAGYRFTFVGPGDGSFRALAEELRAWAGVEFVEAPLRGKRCRLWWQVRAQLCSGRFALMHSHGLTAAAHAAWANRGLGVPHVVTSHDVFRPDQAVGLVRRVKIWVLGRLLRRADAIVSVTQDAQQNLLEYLPQLETGRCHLLSIPHGIDARRFAAMSSPVHGWLRRRLGLSDDIFLMGFLGRFMEQKGFLPLLGALQRVVGMGKTSFHLAAVGSGDYVREYRREVAHRGLTGYISFMDHVPDPGPLLRELDLLVMPSLWEAAGLLAMEAMVAGIPVLGSDCIGLREVLRDTPSMIIPAGDEEVLALALCRAMASPWTDQARAFAATARERFSAARSAQRLKEVLDSVAA
jgi:glycosyltransferase involved in cell wall biosynthesis